MRLRKFWSMVLAFWTLLLAFWTVLCWNCWGARAAENVGSYQAEIGEARRNPRPASKAGGRLDVPFLDQRDSFPTGCESVCAVMVLQYYGADVTVDEFIDGYLPLGDAPHWDVEGNYVGCDPRKAFPGNPRTEGGWGCWAPVIEDSLERLLRDRPELSLSVKELQGASLEELCKTYVEAGVPVLVWATIDMEEPWASDTFLLEDTGEEFTWLYPLHCLVLVGRDEKNYYFNAPLAGKSVPYSRAASESAYQGLGEQAVVLLPG